MDSRNSEDWIKRMQDHRGKLTPEQVFEGIREGNIGALSSGITLIESQKSEHRADANALIQLCLPFSGNSIRIGITGVPGVGKSTFIEAFGQVLTGQGKKVAVLAVDPSSSVSGGSILGDKTRMQSLSIQPNVYIRPSAAGETLGGVARKTRESILLCEATGFDVILVETVGVGQSETVVKSMVDFFLLLMLSGAGDELQGIKKGIMEMADSLVITKADGDNIKKAELAERIYKNSLHLFPARVDGWETPVFTCSAIEGRNIRKVYDVIRDYHTKMTGNGFFELKRHEQDKQWLQETLKELILSEFFSDQNMMTKLKTIERKVVNGELTSFQGAEILHTIYKDGRRI